MRIFGQLLLVEKQNLYKTTYILKAHRQTERDSTTRREFSVFKNK